MIRFASPGAQDWAKAMRREMDFIETDWTALLWALGSTRILFTRRDVPVANLSDIPRAAQNFTKKTRRRTLSNCAATLATSVVFGRFIFTFTHPIPYIGSSIVHPIMVHPIQRIGFGFVAASMLYGAYQNFVQRVREAPGETDPSACAISYRANLARQRDLHCGWRLWSGWVTMSSGFLLICVGGVGWLAAVLVTFSVLTVMLDRWEARKCQRQIDELDALAKEA
ncbi:MAG: hypothetical protein WAM69_05115 [Candidatus Sulfotelmatobacter sp.]